MSPLYPKSNGRTALGKLEDHSNGPPRCKRLTGYEELVVAVAATDDLGHMRLVDNDADSLHFLSGGTGNPVKLQAQPVVIFGGLGREFEHGATAHGPGRFFYVRPTLAQKLEPDTACEAFNQSFTAHLSAP